jgi:hypothetical protein
MNDILNKKIAELEEIIKFIKRENGLLRFENDSLVKRDKLQDAINDKLRQRIDNMSKELSRVKVNINQTKQFNDNTITHNEIIPTDNEIRSEYNEIILDSNDIKQENIGIKQESNDIKQENNDIKQDNNDIKQEGNDIKQDNNEIKQESNEIKQDNNEIKQESNEIKEESNENRINNYDSIKQYNDKLNITKNLKKVFKKRYIDKVINKLTEEIYYLNTNDKIKVSDITNAINLSVPTFMRNMKLLKKNKWVEYIGSRKNGYYSITNEGRKMMEKKIEN